MLDAPYHPIQPGIPSSLMSTVQYKEIASQSIDSTIVYRYWTLETNQPLDQPFDYLILPDGCIDIVFDLAAPPAEHGALIMTPHTTSVRVPLGTAFRYAGIRLYPGAWQLSPIEIVGDMKTKQFLGGIDLGDVQKRLAATTHPGQLWPILEECGHTLQKAGVIHENPVITALLAADPTSVADIARQTGYSIRHIQRVLQRSVGFTPHNFIKVIRFQRALRTQDFSLYADQPHYIREFKRITSMTPQAFYRMYPGVA